MTTATPRLFSTPASLKKRLETRIRLLQVLTDGLAGKTFSWGQGEAKNYFPMAASLGCTLRTKTAIERMGLILKPKAKPVGYAYYGAPIQEHCALYIVEVHATIKEEKTNAEV